MVDLRVISGEPESEQFMLLMACHKGEPGRFSHVIDVTLHQRPIDCMVGIDINLRKGDRVLRRGYFGERTHWVFQVFQHYCRQCCIFKSCKAITLTYTAVELLHTLLCDSTTGL